ncbi:MAG TPA: virion core protein (lumpy skin disease virus) [Spirochaetaceae bacterium]|nr:virion core protein (lumpy skin disease virus) [Spirochaetaceae bacterium]
MGLIKALTGSVGSMFGDQWKEYFYCEAISSDTLVVKGVKRTSSRSSNTKGTDNVISNGSGIVVADGQCMLIVDQGKVVDLCSEPGLYTFDKSSEPSIFSSGLGKGIIDSFKTIGRRFAYGADAATDQRVYYFNTKEITDNKFGTQNPVPFRAVDSKIGLDLDVSIRCAGIYSYRVTDPLKFYANVCGNISSDFKRSEIDSQLKAEFVSALQPSFGRLSQLELRPNQIPLHTTELENALNDSLSQKWGGMRGIEVSSVAIISLTLPDEDADMIKKIQKAAILRDPLMAAASMTEAHNTAIQNAASNSAGAMNGFVGMGMAGSMSGMGGAGNIQSLYQMGMNRSQMGAGQNQASMNQNQGRFGGQFAGQPQSGFSQPQFTQPQPAQPQPMQSQPAQSGWKCSCGTVNSGKFCTECGSRRPPQEFRCDKCGWKPSDPANVPKFCPNCGDRFDEYDIV